jgi:transcriptional regulator with XRE-family HTH domain
LCGWNWASFLDAHSLSELGFVGEHTSEFCPVDRKSYVRVPTVHFPSAEGKRVNVATKDPDQELGERFKALRKRLGLTQDDVAKGGLRRTEVTDVEKGRNKATSDRVVSALARGFGVSADVVKALRDNMIDVERAAESAKPLPNAPVRVVEPVVQRAEPTGELSQREREWLAVGLMARGVEEGPAYRIAYTLQFDVGAEASAVEILEAALWATGRSKLTAPRAAR